MRAHPAGPLHGGMTPPPSVGLPPADLGALDPQVWPRSAQRVDGELHLAGRRLALRRAAWGGAFAAAGSPK